MSTADDRRRVLFLCTGNSCRSQMAEGFLRAIAGERFAVESAGTRPSVVNPRAIQVMREVGIDISGQRSKSVDDLAGREFDAVITVCEHAREACPVYPARTERLHWSFDDPAEAAGAEAEVLAVFRRVRDEIGARVRQFASETA